jgi:hypothetical protein
MAVETDQYKSDLNTLRLAAAHRAEADRTRVSVSGVVSDLVRANRELLERKP